MSFNPSVHLNGGYGQLERPTGTGTTWGVFGLMASSTEVDRGVKTLHITNAYHPTSGGIRTFYDALLRAADDCQRHVRLIVPGPRDAVEQIGRFARIQPLDSLRQRIRSARTTSLCAGFLLTIRLMDRPFK